MPWTRVQANGAAASSVAFASDVGVDNLLVVLGSDGGALSSVNDTRGNTWTPMQVYSGGQTVRSWYTKSKDSGPCTVTHNGSSFQGIVVAEYSFGSGGWEYKGSTKADGTSADHPVGPLNVDADDCIAVALFGSDDNNAVSVSAAGGATLDVQAANASAGNDRNAIESLFVNEGSVSMSWSMTNCSGTSHLAAFGPPPVATQPKPYTKKFPKTIMRSL